MAITDTYTPEEVFRAEYNGARNFITPNVHHYDSQGAIYVEVSYGEAILRPAERLYGVTVLERTGPGPRSKQRPDLSGAFDTLGAANKHVDQILGRNA